MSASASRIAKNTLILYFRQMVVMLAGLYTVRVVLKTLGAEDYGIYGVVAGTITIFEFLSNSVAMAIRRWLSFALGQHDIENTKKVFGISFAICFIIMVLIVFLAETIGLWFVNNRLVMPENRRLAAQWAYQFAIGGFLCVIAVIPCSALIIAHEDMNILAYISIIEVLLKLVLVFILQIISIDKLPLYGFLLLITGIMNLVMYLVVCKKKYHEYRFRPYWDKDLFKKIAAYTGWNCLSTSTVSCRNQGTAILLNQYFGPLVVAARNISFSVNSAVASLMFNFTMALRPQIIKSYAANDREKMLSLTFLCSKMSYFLMYIFSLPFILEMPYILSIWLQTPPDYAVIFSRLVLIEILIGSLSIGFTDAVRSSEKIKLREIIISIIYLFNLPLLYVIFLILPAPPYTTAYSMVFLTLIALIAEIFIARHLIGFSMKLLASTVIAPICIVTVVSAIVPVLVLLVLPQGILRLCLLTGLSVISMGITTYLFGLNTAEQRRIKSILREKFQFRL